MLQRLRAVRERVHRLVWDEPLDGRPRWQRTLIELVRLAAAVARDFAGGALTLHAMSLVFTTLLALVPLVAVSFSVLKGFGVHNQIEPALLQLLAPLGERAPEITGRIVDFVDNIKVGVLGAVGVALLLYTAVSLVQKIEQAFNYTWNVDRRRTLVRRFSDYFSVIIVGPVLVFLALAITASFTSSAVAQAVMEIEPFGFLLRMLGRLVPYLLVIAAFTFIYVLIPNTHVRLGPALFGGVVAGVLWETVGRIFATFVVTSANYTAVYSGFAILLLFMIWLYLSWLVLLTGSTIAFYRQHPEYVAVGGRNGAGLSPAQHERVAVAVMLAVVRDWYDDRPPPDRARLAQRLGLPVQPVDRALAVLVEAGLLAPSGHESRAFLPARPPGDTPVKRVLDAVRHHGERTRLLTDAQSADAAVMRQVDSALAGALGGHSVAELAARTDAVAETPSTPDRRRSARGPT